MLAHLGAMLAHLGAMLAHLGAMLAHLGAMLVPLGGYVGPSWGYVRTSPARTTASSSRSCELGWAWAGGLRGAATECTQSHLGAHSRKSEELSLGEGEIGET